MAPFELAPDTRLVAVVGMTASGKSSLAMDLALRHNGELICADSRTLYQGMDIGTAKPSKADQSKVPHHLLDIIRPDQHFDVAQFQAHAKAIIADIQKRGKLPILVGGTGLYIDAVLYNYDFDEQTRQPLLPHTFILGVQVPDKLLRERITTRVDAMIDQGLEAEVEALANTYSWAIEAMKGIGYREWQAYFASPRNSEDLIKTKELIVQNTWQYARRQRTWFRRNQDIHWDSPVEQPSATIEG